MRLGGLKPLPPTKGAKVAWMYEASSRSFMEPLSGTNTSDPTLRRRVISDCGRPRMRGMNESIMPMLELELKTTSARAYSPSVRMPRYSG